MRRILRVVLAASSLSAAMPAGAEDLTIVSTVTTPRGTTRTQTQYLSAARIRMSDGDRDTIVNLGSGKVTLLEHRRKEYSETSLDELRAFLDQIDAAMAGRPLFDRAIGATAGVRVEKETSRKKVAGYDTEKYTLTMGEAMRFEVWTAPALRPPDRYYDARKVLYATMGPMGRRFDRMFDEMKKIAGLPLASEIEYRMRVTRREVNIEATDVRKGPIPDSAFAAPGDYKRVESPFGAGRAPRPSP